VSPTPGYRADIDGLRAVAVISVIGFHAFPAAVPGGFVGVDVFFVISGYLISSLIFEGLRAGRFSYADFYARRVRRIFPALIVVLVATLAVGATIDFPDEFRQLGKQAFAGAAFVSNLDLARGVGYFLPTSETKPFLHLWSLGIEEQFYLLWPVTAALLWRRPWALAAGLVAITLGSFLAGLLMSSVRPVEAYYWPLTRFWELFAGALLAWLVVFRGAPWRTSRWVAAYADALAIAGAGLIAASVFLISRDHPFPGWRAALPVAGALLVVAAGPDARMNAALLARRPIVFIGLISYPLYLWHWPLLAFMRMLASDAGVAARAMVVAASFVLAWATYRFVERPIRFGPRRRLAIAPLCAGIAAIAVAGIAIRLGWLENGGMNERAAFVARFENQEPRYKYLLGQGIGDYYRFDCDYYDLAADRAKASIAPSCYATALPRSVMIWGDSFAQSLYYGLRAALPPDVALLQVATSACRPALEDLVPDPFGACNRSNRFALQVVRDRKPDVVVVTQRERHEQADWDALAGALLDAGAKRVLVVGPLPEWMPELHRIIARDYWEAPPERVARGLSQAKLETDAILKRRHGPASRYQLLSPMDALCDARGCLAYLGPDRFNDLMAFDYGHLTPRGSLWVGAHVLGPVVLGMLDTGRPAANAGAQPGACASSSLPASGCAAPAASSRFQARPIQK
jgi:peptidoglycan/LPS O-acetylase OafA/YrhL